MSALRVPFIIGAIAVSGCVSKYLQLVRLGDDLRASRAVSSLEQHDPCRLRLRAILGAARRSVEAELGPPDFTLSEVAFRESYFFARPRDKPTSSADDEVVVSAGGGFPIVSISFDSESRVSDIQCSYAR